VARRGGRPLVHTHDLCGKDFDPVMVCSECGEPLLPKQVHVRPGPSAKDPRHLPLETDLPAPRRLREREGGELRRLRRARRVGRQAGALGGATRDPLHVGVARRSDRYPVAYSPRHAGGEQGEFPRETGSHLTRRWREVDSNHRSRPAIATELRAGVRPTACGCQFYGAPVKSSIGSQ